MAQAVFGGGCFWCTEAVFLALKGVESVISGYAGGIIPHPSYEQICKGNTEHAEVIQINFDDRQISFIQLLDVFFATHNPTTLNRQGNDIGTQYRSVIFYTTDEQREQASDYIDHLKTSGLNIVTELSPLPTFYIAEEYHQNFYARNPSQGYCNFAIPPKLIKLQSKFSKLLKE